MAWQTDLAALYNGIPGPPVVAGNPPIVVAGGVASMPPATLTNDGYMTAAQVAALAGAGTGVGAPTYAQIVTACAGADEALDLHSQKITSVAAGTEPDDVATVSQLGGGDLTYAQVKAAIGAADSALDLHGQAATGVASIALGTDPATGGLVNAPGGSIVRVKSGLASVDILSTSGATTTLGGGHGRVVASVDVATPFSVSDAGGERFACDAAETRVRELVRLYGGSAKAPTAIGHLGLDARGRPVPFVDGAAKSCLVEGDVITPGSYSRTALSPYLWLRDSFTLSSSGYVTQWNDLSGNARHCVTNTPSVSIPVGTQTGLRALLMGSPFYTSSSSLVLSGYYSLFVAIRMRWTKTTDNTYRTILGLVNQVYDGCGVFIAGNTVNGWQAGDVVAHGHGYGGQPTIGGDAAPRFISTGFPAFADSEWLAIAVRIGATGTSKILVNGISLTARKVDDAAATASSAGAIWVGSNPGGGDQWDTLGAIAEFVLVDGVVGDTAFDAMHAAQISDYVGRAL